MICFKFGAGLANNISYNSGMFLNRSVNMSFIFMICWRSYVLNNCCIVKANMCLSEAHP